MYVAHPVSLSKLLLGWLQNRSQGGSCFWVRFGK
jgi:hypothetical protein